MPNVAVLLADGFETVEALTVVDVLRRAGIRVRTVSVMGTTQVITAQQVQITADGVLADLDDTSLDCVVVPGGLPATKRLRADTRVCALLREAMADPEKTVAAICAGPSILASLGLLEGRRATVFPGCETDFPDGVLDSENDVVVDGDLITARSMSRSLRFAIAIVERLAGPDAARKVLQGVAP